MSAALRKLHAVRRACNVPDELYRDILKNQTGRESAKGISFAEVNKCVAEFEKLRPVGSAPGVRPVGSAPGVRPVGSAPGVRPVGSAPGVRPIEPAKPNWRPTAKSAHARKVYALWTALKKQGKVTTRYPDAFVKRMSGVDRAEFLTPHQANPVIEALRDWKRRPKKTKDNLNT